ncbi:hypothetical protein STHU_07950 [Allostella humosa]|nr:hypothetical protein STHU_07950 [Stella humosa]
MAPLATVDCFSQEKEVPARSRQWAVLLVMGYPSGLAVGPRDRPSASLAATGTKSDPPSGRRRRIDADGAVCTRSTPWEAGKAPP